jgi:hypothetical protein
MSERLLDPSRRISANSSLLPTSSQVSDKERRASQQVRRLCLVCGVFAILLAAASGLAVYILTRHDDSTPGKYPCRSLGTEHEWMGMPCG